jgi:hypothetical protein
MNERSLQADNARLRREIQLLRSKIAVLEKEKRKPVQPDLVAPSYAVTTETGWTPKKQAKLEASDPYYAHVMQQRRRKRGSWLDQ